MRQHTKRFLVLTMAIIFLVLGLIGLVLPVLQGVLFLIIGLILLSLCFPKVRLFIKHHTEKRPHLSPIVNKIEAWIAKFIGEL